MTNIEAKILFFILLIICVWLTLKLLFNIIDNVTDYLIKKYSNDQKWTLKVPYTTVIQESIYFTNNILYAKGIKHFPKFQISYYKHKRFQGHYNNDVITIFKKKNKTICDVVEITLHEVAHYIQNHTDDRYKEYETYSSKVGYENNPLEVEARDFASQHLNDCLIYLEEKGMVKRV